MIKEMGVGLVIAAFNNLFFYPILNILVEKKTKKPGYAVAKSQRILTS